MLRLQEQILEELEDLAEEIGLAFPSDDFDTLGGFVFDLLGKIPVWVGSCRLRGQPLLL